MSEFCQSDIIYSDNKVFFISADRKLTAIKTESPMEALLLGNLLRLAPGDLWWEETHQGNENWGFNIFGVARSDNPPFLIPQLVIGTYRVDFAVIGYGVKIVVEVDGHDFHERTKEQAQRDKKRDRDLQAEGWSVLRFTGSEIYADADRCAREIMAMVKK